MSVYFKDGYFLFVNIVFMRFNFIYSSDYLILKRLVLKKIIKLFYLIFFGFDHFLLTENL